MINLLYLLCLRAGRGTKAHAQHRTRQLHAARVRIAALEAVLGSSGCLWAVSGAFGHGPEALDTGQPL
eukprot:3081653-Alexandrium_andersonii.AAC.1